MTITESHNDIFAAPPSALLLHACNTLGSWSAGVALAFKKKYPSAYTTYHSHCIAHKDSKEALLGTCLLIPPQSSSKKGKEGDGGKQHWIGCLFTSVGYGRNKSSKKVILESTEAAMGDLKRQIDALGPAATEEGEKSEKKEGDSVGEVWAVRINSGLFAVPWEETKAVLEGSGVDVRVVRPEGEEEKVPTGGRKRVLDSGERGGSGGRGRGGAKRAKGGSGRGRGERGGLREWLKG